MSQGSSVSRRIHSCLNHTRVGEYEAAMIDFFPALDKTAKRRRPNAGVGERIRTFLADQEAIISVLATNNFIKNISMNGVTFPEAIYKFGRTSIAHEGELDPRLTFNDEGSLRMGHTWNLPSSYIPALCVAVMVAPENASEHISEPFAISFLGVTFEVNSLWGQEAMIQKMIASKFGDPHLFESGA
jgi:hypothetical protein